MIAADDGSDNSSRLFITDRCTKINFLVDTGADLCIHPRRLVRERRTRSRYELYAANNSTIATYGFLTLSLNLGLRRDFTWRFVVADVAKPIIGADFLSFYGLLVDVRNRRLVDSATTLTVGGKTATGKITSIKSITVLSKYHEILSKFPEITRPAGAVASRAYTTFHHIRTTPGPPVFSRPRRLARKNLQLQKKRFLNCNNWALHNLPKAVGLRHFTWCQKKRRMETVR